MVATMMTYISEEPACLTQILRDYRQKLAAIETFARQHPVRRILLLATGSSLNAALCARYFFEQRFGVLVEIKEPYNFTHYEAVDPHTDLVVAISQSGKSASTLEAMRKVQALSLPVFALTSDPQSPIARACDGILDINTGIESVGFVTRGVSATVLNLLLMALTIARSQGKASEAEEQRYLAELQRLAAAIPDVIDRTSRFIDRHGEALRGGERFVATGYGALVGVAKEFETKFTETVRVPSSGFELEAYMHGPYLEVNCRHVMLFIEDVPDGRTRALRDYMAPSIARAFTLTLSDDEDAQTLALNCPCEHHLAPLLLIVPVQMLAWHTAGLKGIDLAKRIFDDFDRVLKSKI
ncbi:SIS domain-containing protein [Salmonella enterica subsp. enterica]|nr:SIS domain-containing protein [Salmonella enterica subsp. enterica]ECI0980647.1 SIS domain-containing protein [Salmonella enterica subsp. enterica serovar Newport]ECO0901728.1 SIS domain-containing protein [Salmonella enterica subsp. enterica serovar Newport]ECO1013366.1 SIS domain-containing protein [Salmonella enterica subsp. enterica serovar Newport]EDQ2991658.1 SIS domain-containing protein [Salmonella enterica subsp. enterica]